MKNLITKLYEIEENGQTALGPAILFSINLINGISSGSRVILCTDGISNMGIGSMEDKTKIEEVNQLKDFYSNLGHLAKEKGVVVDLITFEGEQSNIEILMSMIDQTGGEIIRVKPEEILDQFSNLLSNEVIASKVSIKVKLHKLMKFRNEDSKNLENEGTLLTKQIGNVTKESELYVEYCFKDSENIAKLADIDLENFDQVPFQTIIDYTNKNGDRCIRVVTKSQKLCSEKEIIQNNANYNIISTNAMQKSSQLAKEGNYREAQSNALAWKRMIKSQACNSNSNAFESYKIFNNNMNDFNNNIQQLQFENIQMAPEKKKTITDDKISSQIHAMKSMSSKRSEMNYKKSKK
jgi:hypothetical protein